MKIVSCFFLFSVVYPLLASCVEKQVYIVHFREDSGETKALHEIEETHLAYLDSVKETEEEDAKSSLLYSYKHAINGFAALLTPDQASKLSEIEEVVSVFPTQGRSYSLQTTRSWEFVGLMKENDGLPWDANKMGGEDLLAKASYGKDVIIGVLDSGVWPESPSFSDEGMEPIPQSWKGICQEGVAFNSSYCNKKIIGARYFVKGFKQQYGKVNASEDYLSPRDMDGHGTHTASTAAGRDVANAAAMGGFAEGTASGGAPLARLAIYKVCWARPNVSKLTGNTCFFEDMLAGMDSAIADGVHIISVSIASNEQSPYDEDALAIGALHATKRNILVVCSAGNKGPNLATMYNPAPWLMTVAASSVDREFLASVILGNGGKVMGQSVTKYQLGNHMYPLINAEDAVVPGVPENATGQCLPDSLDPNKVNGKIVVCWRGAGFRIAKGLEVKRAGGAGFILANSQANGNAIEVDPHFLPATSLTYNDATKILEYIKNTPNPMATIGRARTVLHHKPAPSMAAFSSKGPNVIDPNILKPDITAPGIDILAAWTNATAPTKWEGDPRRVKYNLYSGTSMSCPHVSGAAALLRAIHPDWSISAIRSALMTTARITNNLGQLITDDTGKAATPFHFGAGHFQPIKAADPGLIYDASYDDYLLYLCSIGQNKLDPTFHCPENPPSAVNLNYPSFAIPKLNGTFSIKRTVTNVGCSNSTYFFSAKPPPGVHVEASPSLLCFDHLGQKLSFTITVSPAKFDSTIPWAAYGFGWYTWRDGFYHVRSPMAVYLP